MTRKTQAQIGFETLMNSPANPLTKEGLQAFRAIKKASGLSTRETLEYLGSKPPSKKPKEEVKQGERLANLTSDK